jgi:hypothetical protein
MEDTSGFYKKDEQGNWLHAVNAVYTKDYTLLRELKDTYTYPVDGWAWYDEQPK